MGTLHTSDLVEYAEIKEGKDGLEAQRGFQVENLSGNPDQRALEALNVPGIPSYGDVHPSIPILFTFEKRFETQGPTIGVVVVSYKQLEADEQEAGENQAPIISIGSTVQEDVVNLDVGGRQMLLYHTRRKITVVGEGVTRVLDEPMPPQPAEISMQFPQMTVTFTRKESGSPFHKHNQFGGTINSVPFFGLGPHEWLCTGIPGDSTDGGRTFLVSYNFQRSAKGTTWDPLAVYTDPETGAPISGLNINGGSGPLSLSGKPPNKTSDPFEVGLKRFRVYPQEDFNKMHLDFGQAAGGQGAGIVISKPGSTRLRFPPLKKGQ